MTAVRINNLEYQARCLMKTKIRLDQRSFSDFTIDELNDYASCIYDLGKRFHIDFKEFSLNRINKDFTFTPIISETSWPGCWTDIEQWEWFFSFLQYLFNVNGAEKFEFLVRVTKQRLSNWEKKQFNEFAKEFCNCTFYDLWGLFNQHKIVKQKVLDYYRLKRKGLFSCTIKGPTPYGVSLFQLHNYIYSTIFN